MGTIRRFGGNRRFGADMILGGGEGCSCGIMSVARAAVVMPCLTLSPHAEKGFRGG